MFLDAYKIPYTHFFNYQNALAPSLACICFSLYLTLVYKFVSPPFRVYVMSIEWVLDKAYKFLSSSFHEPHIHFYLFSPKLDWVLIEPNFRFRRKRYYTFVVMVPSKPREREIFFNIHGRLIVIYEMGHSPWRRSNLDLLLSNL